jgi:catechol 2,3-dioxygenase-like lactoylglutathione lyase family enzyme
MIHVPDVAATADWYQALGFTVLDRGSDGEEIVFARLVLGTSELLLDAGGRASDADRR